MYSLRRLYVQHRDRRDCDTHMVEVSGPLEKLKITMLEYAKETLTMAFGAEHCADLDWENAVDETYRGEIRVASRSAE
jgi:hypothetical protein